MRNVVVKNVKLREQMEKLSEDLGYYHIHEISSWQLRQLYDSLGDELRRRNHLELREGKKSNS